MTRFDHLARTLAAIAFTLVASATMVIGAVGPAYPGNADTAAAIVRTIA